MSFRQAATTVAPTRELLDRLRAQAEPEARAGLPVFPVHPVVAGLLPDGGLRTGSAYQVAGGSLLLALLAEPSKAGHWCGVVGVPELGVEAASQAGVALDRLALVPAPGERWLSVVAALAEVLPVVAVRPPSRVRDADAARLAARLRERGTVLLVAGEWPRTEATLTLGEARWAGLGVGHGRLTSREVEVQVTSRRLPGPRTARLVLPDATGAATAAEAARSASLEATPLKAVG